MANLRVDKITSTETFETTGSVQFDGVNDGLTISDNAAFDLGTGDFTIEGWYYIKPQGSYLSLFDWRGSGADGVYPALIKHTSGDYIYYYVDADYRITNVTIQYNTWFHVAVCRSSGITRLFLNGKEKGRFADTFDYISRDILLGISNSDSNDLAGNISNYRAIKGRALYTANFKPPMRELENVPGTILLCCQSKTDATLEKTGKTITANGNAVASELTPGILTPVPKAGAGSAITGSVEFDKTRDYLEVADNGDFDASGDFTIEFWANLALTETNGWLIGKWNSGSNEREFLINGKSDGVVEFYWSTDGNTHGALSTSSGTITANQWNHYAWVKNGSVLTGYINGVALVSKTDLTSQYHNSSNSLFIGTISSTGTRADGFISNLRIVKGTALYTDDFIPPTRELKKVPGTVLLCCQDENSVTTEATGKVIYPYGSLAGPDSSRPNIGQNLVTNGTFDSDTSGWTVLNTGTFTASSGQATLSDSDGTGTSPVAYQEITTFVPGKMYVFQFDTVAAREAYAYVSTTAGSNTLPQEPSSTYAYPAYTGSLTGTRYIRFRATQSTMQINFSDGSGSDFDVTVDNVKVYQIDPGSAGSNFTPQVGDDRKVTFEGVTKINSDAYFYLPTGDTASRETTGTYSGGTRGIFGGGFSNPTTDHDTIQHINIASTGDAVDAGDLTQSRFGNGACASSTRALWAAGLSVGPNEYWNIIDYVTISSAGDALDFGDLTYGVPYYTAAVSNTTRGIWGGGYNSPSSPQVPSPFPSGFQNEMEYVTIASTGNGKDFGDFTARNSHSTFGSPTRGIFAGGATPSKINTIEYVTIATTGNASDFGDLTNTRNYGGGCSSAIRGLVGGGSTPTMVNTIDYVTIASTGNAVDFGDISTIRSEVAACSSSTRGVFAGSWSPAKTNVMDYVNIQTTANAKDFGELVNIGVMQECGTSNGHGGLG